MLPSDFMDRAIHIIAMFGRFEQGLFARLPILRGFALWWLKHTAINQALARKSFNAASIRPVP
jgi:hypothetical protein